MGTLFKLFFGASPEGGSDIPELIRNGAVVIDVRTAQEFATGHISGSVNIPYDQIDRLSGDVEKDRPIILYCHSGGRSAAAKRMLEQSGYSRVIDGGGLNRMQKLLAEHPERP